MPELYPVRTVPSELPLMAHLSRLRRTVSGQPFKDDKLRELSPGGTEQPYHLNPNPRVTRSTSSRVSSVRPFS